MTANTQNINALADFIESEKYGFDMDDGSPKPHCGFAGCIGGHAAVLWPELYIRDAGSLKWDRAGFAAKLGISFNQHNDLVFGYDGRAGKDLNLSLVTREQAVKVLRHLAETGEVKWSIIQDGDK